MQSVTRYQKNALHSTNPSTHTLSNTVIWFVGLCGRVARVASIRLVNFSNTSWIPIINHLGKNSPVEPGWIRFPVAMLKLYLRCYFLSSSCLSSLYYSKSTKRDCRECPKFRFAKEIFTLMEMENREGKFKTDFWASHLRLRAFGISRELRTSRNHVSRALPSGLRFEGHVCTASPRSRGKWFNARFFASYNITITLFKKNETF